MALIIEHYLQMLDGSRLPSEIKGSHWIEGIKWAILTTHLSVSLTGGGELSFLNNCSEQFITMCLGNRLYLHLPGIKQLSLHKSWLAFPCALDWSTIIALPLSSPKAKALYWVFISYLMTWACCICLNVAFLWLPHWAHWLGWLLRVPG